MGRLLFWCVFFLFSLTSCAHLRPPPTLDQQRVEISNQISNAFVRIQVVRSYEILACLEENTDVCKTVVQMSKATSFGSGGIIRHNEKTSEILTAAHVVDDFDKLSPLTLEATIGFLSEFSRMTGMPLDEIKFRIRANHLKVVGLKTVIYAVASDGEAYPVQGSNCKAATDACIVITPKIKGIVPIKISSSPPQIGDKVLIASGPFGYAIPGMMVPIFEGIYSGMTPDKKDYYTLQVVPGSSGSLVVNASGEVVGIVSMFITGSFCPPRLGCQVLPSGIMVSVPLSIIEDLVYPKGK